VRAERVSGIGEPVDVERPGQQRSHGHGENHAKQW
jgi:hypothetical protein